MIRLPIVIFGLTFLAAGCDRAPETQDLNALDAELVNAPTARDPAIADALAGQIMVDPRLTQSANADVIRPPARPDTGETPSDAIAGGQDQVDPTARAHAPAAAEGCPDCEARDGALTLGALAGRQRDARTAACADRVRYSAGWANRLPRDLALYPTARVIEAAGTDADGCALRVVNFRADAPPLRVIDWYYAQTRKAGYTVERQASATQQVLGGRHAGVAFLLYVAQTPGGGSDIDLIASGTP